MITKDHLSLITTACSGGDVATLRDLTKGYASTKREIETINLMTGLTALGQAAVRGQVEVVRHLLEVADADIFAENEWKITPLLAMASHPVDKMEGGEHTTERDASHASICRLLVDKVKNVEQERVAQIRLMQLPTRQDIDLDKFPFLRTRLLQGRSHELLGGNTAAHYAAARGKPLLLSQIIRSGLDVNCLNVEQATPLHIGACLGHAPVVQELIKREANVDAINYRGDTPLMLACHGLHHEVVSLLLNRANADVKIVAFHSSINCLHALALGITRTHRSRYMGGNKMSKDSLSICLQGYNPLSKGFIDNSWGQPPVIYLSMPVFEPECGEIFLFTDTFQKRLSSARTILDTLLKHCPPSMCTERSRVGYTAAELLKHRANYILEEYQNAWSRSDLRLKALPEDQRLSCRQEWREIFNQIDLIIQCLTVKGPAPQLKEEKKDQATLSLPPQEKEQEKQTVEKLPAKVTDILPKVSLSPKAKQHVTKGLIKVPAAIKKPLMLEKKELSSKSKPNLDPTALPVKKKIEPIGKFKAKPSLPPAPKKTKT